ncbi:hypothetical protein B0H63DRAFT_491569 [Podospora didyma]|uniref:DUF1479 domain protein n=1 Tax=Podospora didyma TaxID=330526 RepID=A0AAE0U7Y0_9PEZI|nr:hypothetical protein B0H63DRAFT_491569 [Podospora didyma]
MPSAVSVDNISAAEFADWLGRYPSCIEAISQSKPAKSGQKTLAELDRYRYGEAVDAFGSGKKASMTLDDVKTLVEWKLRHGKFRPTLMKLVSSNEPDTAKETVQKATKLYRDKSDVSGALGILTQLKGIGPATASLLLAVHDAENVIFFADEAFYWLCCGGSKAPIKYNLKEYIDLNERGQAISKRLGVKAVDVERVAFVLMRQQTETVSAIGRGKPDSEISASNTKQQPAKRKIPADNSDIHVSSARRDDEMHSFSSPDPIPLHHRFAVLKERLTSGNESSLATSWRQLLRDISDEIDIISHTGSQIIPTIDFADITKPACAAGFLTELRQRGVAVIRNVVPRDTALKWRKEAGDYVDQNSSYPKSFSTADDHKQLCELYWSPAQVEARAHQNILTAQKFAMGGMWKSKDPVAKVSTNFPITYADRIRTRTDSGRSNNSAPTTITSAHVDGGSVERWENDGYGRAGTYRDIFQGHWEEYDPWESSTRIGVTSDLYRGTGACSIFRMFQGMLALSHNDNSPSSSSPILRVCPMPKLATAYLLLRPFFSLCPKTGDWTFDSPQNSILHGAVPGHAQAANSALHPHLQLNRSLVAIPHLKPGDYVIWHPDLVYTTTTDDAVDSSSSVPYEPPHHMNISIKIEPDDDDDDNEDDKQRIIPPNNTSAELYLYLPACPLTQTNALYLSQQRKAFLQGFPAPDFGGGRKAESYHLNRPGAQGVSNTGGDGGLQAMGLLPWNEEDADFDAEREVLAIANAILFPDLYDML